MKDVLVVGAGPAGMMAAITAAENGARVTLLEKMQRVGRKMLITGKGRCNLTNAAPVPELIRQFFKNLLRQISNPCPATARTRIAAAPFRKSKLPAIALPPKYTFSLAARRPTSLSSARCCSLTRASSPQRPVT